MISDLGIIFKVYLISLGLQFLVWPWVNRWFKGLVDGGWALGRVVSLLVIGLPIWFVGHALPVNTDVGVVIMILLLVLIGLRSLRTARKQGSKLFYQKMIFVEEGLFLAGLLGLSLIRGFQPDILGLEKFMDFGFIKQYLISSKLPVNDMWLAGESMNYYSFGHFLVSVLVRIWGVGLGVGYNLMLAWILGTSLALSFSIIVNLLSPHSGRVYAHTRRREVLVIMGGVMGAMLTCLGGNSHVLWYLVKNKSISGYWYADATRFIENTIHEYPGYSFVVSDLHAHVLGLPIVLAFILVLIGKGVKGGVLLGVLLGVMAMTNTWDVATYGLLLVVFGLVLLINKKIKIKKLLVLAGKISIVAGITALPWFLNFKSFSHGVYLTGERSPLWQVGVLWGGHVVMVIAAMFIALKLRLGFVPPRGRNFAPILALGVTALLLLLIPEIVYVKDIYPGHQRANTMFKLTYQAFIMMSLLFGWVVGKVFSRCRPLKVAEQRFLLGSKTPVRNRLSLFLLMVVTVLWGGLMFFPIQAFSSYYGGFKKYKGLDGLVWLKKDKDRWSIIRYLENNRDGRNLVEAVGDSYTKFNSVSAFSGTPTVVGWRVHEWLWRGGYDVVKEREGLVKNFYEKGTLKILEDFNVGWVVVGPDEKKEYEVNENKLFSLGEVVWRGKESYLIKVTD